MFGWLKKKQTRADAEAAVGALMDKWLGPSLMLNAVADAIRAYKEAVAAGTAKLPAYKHGDGVVAIWEDTRLEALTALFGFGAADASLLVDMRQQSKLLACLLDDKVHLEHPQPRGEPLVDTVQAMFRVYQYLDAVGSSVADRETDRATLHLKRKHIFDDLIGRAHKIREQWSAFEDATARRGDLPRTLFQELFDDVTEKTKSIALSAKFGPSYEDNIRHLEREIEKEGGDPTRFRSLIGNVLRATDPGSVERVA